jgi:hypothetical protein
MSLAIDAAPGREDSVAGLSRQRALIEVIVAYGLILAVVWSPRPVQRYLWWVAVLAVFTIVCASFQGLNAAGMRAANFLRSFWVVGVALLLAAGAIVVAAMLHTLRLSRSPLLFFESYVAYAVWSGVQQFLLQCVFLWRMLRLLPARGQAAFAAAALFALAHLPNPILATVTVIWGVAACLIFLRYRNLWTLAIAHAILGITIAITVPGYVDHNMRVGLGYLTYHRPHLALVKPK